MRHGDSLDYLAGPIEIGEYVRAKQLGHYQSGRKLLLAGPICAIGSIQIAVARTGQINGARVSALQDARSLIADPQN